MRWRRQLIVGAVLALSLAGVARGTTLGDPSMTSNNFSINESEVGASGDFSSASGHFKFSPSTDDGGSTLGDNFVGNSSSFNFQSGAGFNTTAQPNLTFIVNTPTVSLGNLSTSLASLATATFSVSNYTSYGYVVQVVGSPPSNSGHSLAALTSDTASATSQEQFGINVVRNTSAAIGADPTQVPGSTFSYGVAGDGSTGTFGTTRPYTISDKWRYNSGETIASAPKTSGETDYTLTFLANISTLTPGGKYTGNISLVATGTY